MTETQQNALSVQSAVSAEVKATQTAENRAAADAGKRANDPPGARGKGHSPWLLMWARLRSNRAAMAGLGILAILYGGAMFAGFIAPYGYDTQHDALRFHPPMVLEIHFRTADGALCWPYAHGIATSNAAAMPPQYSEDTSRRYPVRLLVRGDSYKLMGIVRSDLHLFGVDKPGVLFVMGSDRFGRDTFSRIMYGSVVSLSVGIAGIVISTAIGMLIGGSAGYFGGATDFLSMRLVEVIMAIPALYFILILRSSLAGTGERLSSSESYLLTVVVLSLIGWATEARVIRGMVLSIREQEYVQAARALGFSDVRIIVKHVLPNTLSFVIVTATLSIPFYILGEVALSFLGVGIQEPEASWGNMLKEAEDSITSLGSLSWILIPGIFIFVAVMAWNLLGEGIRDAADPRTASGPLS